MTTRKRTRLVSQDMKTGEFAYADQLIRDGYYPNLMVLPKNYDPPQPVGPSMRLPLEMLFNPSPQNIHDHYVMVLAEQIDRDTGRGVLLPLSTGTVNIGNSVYTTLTGVSSIGSVNISESDLTNITGVSSVSSIGGPLAGIEVSVTGISSTGSIGSIAVSTAFTTPSGNSSIGSIGEFIPAQMVVISGVSSVGSTGIVGDGIGFGAGGFSDGGFGSR